LLHRCDCLAQDERAYPADRVGERLEQTKVKVAQEYWFHRVSRRRNVALSSPLTLELVMDLASHVKELPCQRSSVDLDDLHPVGQAELKGHRQIPASESHGATTGAGNDARGAARPRLNAWQCDCAPTGSGRRR
jgi:hypothetical protein